MSAPSAAPPAPAPRSRLTPPRLLGAGAFTAVGFVAVWQGFGLAGFGTDVHALRVGAVVVPLFIAGLVIAWPKMWTPMRVFAGLLALGMAVAVWWGAPQEPPPSVGGMSLRDAVKARDSWKEVFATATVESLEQLPSTGKAQWLFKTYPSLTKDLKRDHDQWVADVTKAVVARYDQLPPEDTKSVAKLRETTKQLSEEYPASGQRIEEAVRQWLAKARIAKSDELMRLPFGDWAAFDRTAPGRKVLAEAFPETRDALVRIENDWVDSSVELTVSQNLTPKLGEPPTRRAFWVQTHADVLALKSLDSADGRFAKPRTRLFIAAHTAAQTEVAARLDAGQYDLAFGIARTHAVEWNATAAALGAAEVKKLDSLRETCEFFDKLSSKAAKPVDPAEIAPPPRTKD